MNPSLTQHLDAIQRRLEQTIFPLLPHDEEFAHEQAHFILTSLNVVRSALPHLYRYAVVENVAYRRVLRNLIQTEEPGPYADMIKEQLEEKGPHADEASLSLSLINEQTRRMKVHVSELYVRRQATGGTAALQAQADMMGLARDQLGRERALFASTALICSERSLGEVLDERTAQLAHAD